MTGTANSHASLMDDVYRYQRRIYDATRKYYLLGRDRLIAQMDPAESAHILEIACGTGRNLDKIDSQYPGRYLYGLDISAQMLETAQQKLGTRAKLAQGDACSFDPQNLFGRSGFDHIIMSYSLSMIPDWKAALEEASRHLAPGGTLHLVDFGDQRALPVAFKSMLQKWLAQFHVTPREDLVDALHRLGQKKELRITHENILGRYAQMAQVVANADQSRERVL